MRFLAKIFLFLCIFSLYSLIYKDEIFASQEFSINSTSTYIIDIEGSTLVQHQINLTNQKPDIYATEYALSVASTRVEDVWAKDGSGKLEPKVKKTKQATTISFDFNEQAVGEGKTLGFVIGYNDSDITQKIGQVRELNIPRPETIENYDDYTIKVFVPNAFGSPVQIIPDPDEVESGAHNTSYTFKKSGLLERGVTALFGESQIFAFDLRFTLENPSPIPKTMEITLPPDTQYQKVVYDAIIPLPQNMKVDPDGNWLAEYKVPSRGQIEIHAVGFALITLDADPSVGQTDQDLSFYLNSQAPWQTEDPEIKKLASELKTPENIYRYVVDHLSYDSGRIQADAQRLGAVNAFKNPTQALCMEFTDLFIALARSAGIPARELNGFAYTQNQDLRPLSLRQDILHSWPEYFDFENKIWVPVDPTWGNTTQGIDYFSRFDLNHFVFVVHGLKSDLPYPAGFYKAGNQDRKDITVKPTDQDPKINKLIDIEFSLPDTVTSGLAMRGNLKIKNHGNVALQNEVIETVSSGFDILTPASYKLNVLLPYTEVELPVVIKGSKPFLSRTGSLKVIAVDNTYEKQIQFKSISGKIGKWSAIVALGGVFAAAASRSRSLLLPFKKRFGSLRRKGK